MTDQLKCPSCAGPMKLAHFTPTDKIAKCPYCGKIIDLPDDGSNAKEKITEFSERKEGRDYVVDRAVKVTERNVEFNDLDVEVKDKATLDRIMKEMERIGDKLGSDVEIEFEDVILDEDPTIKGTSRKSITIQSNHKTVHQSSSNDLDALPKEIHDMLADVEQKFSKSSVQDVTFTLGDPRKTCRTGKKSWLQKLFGKK